MGDHLWTILNHLEKLTKQHQRRIAYEQESGIRQEDMNMFILHHLNISVPGNVFFYSNRSPRTSVMNQVL
jgi:hypothetical protein